MGFEVIKYLHKWFGSQDDSYVSLRELHSLGQMRDQPKSELFVLVPLDAYVRAVNEGSTTLPEIPEDELKSLVGRQGTYRPTSVFWNT